MGECISASWTVRQVQPFDHGTKAMGLDVPRRFGHAVASKVVEKRTIVLRFEICLWIPSTLGVAVWTLSAWARVERP